LVETFLSFTAAHLLCAGLVAAFLGSGLPIYRLAVLHRLPFIYMLNFMKTRPFIANPADPMLYLLLFSMDLYLILGQMASLPDNVHLEDKPMPWCMLAGLKYWASEADLLDEQSSEEDDLSDEDVPGTKLYPCCCLLLSTVTAKPASLSVLSCVKVPELSKSCYSSKSKVNFINVGFVVVQPLAPQGWQQVLSLPFYVACGLSAPTAKDPRALLFHLL